MRITKEDMEDTGEDRKRARVLIWKKGCHELSEMKSNWRDCYQSGVNPVTLVYRDKPGSKLD